MVLAALLSPSLRPSLSVDPAMEAHAVDEDRDRSALQGGPLSADTQEGCRGC